MRILKTLSLTFRRMKLAAGLGGYPVGVVQHTTEHEADPIYQGWQEGHPDRELYQPGVTLPNRA